MIICYWSRVAAWLVDDSGNHLLAAGVVGGVGVILTLWRSSIAEKQANAAAEQAKTANRQAENTEKQIAIAVKSQYSERFAKAVEQVADIRLAVRMGGIASLDALSRETAEEYIRVWRYLGDFLRYPPELAGWVVVEHSYPSLDGWATAPAKDSDGSRVGSGEPVFMVLGAPVKDNAGSEEQEVGGKKQTPIGHRPDIVAITTMICNRTKEQLGWEEEKGFRLPLSRARLEKANLAGASLIGANLKKADLKGAILSWANLRKACPSFPGCPEPAWLGCFCTATGG